MFCHYVSRNVLVNYYGYYSKPITLYEISIYGCTKCFAAPFFQPRGMLNVYEPHTYELCRFSLMYTQSEHNASFLFSFETNTNTWKRVVQPHEASNSEQRLLL